MHNDPYSFIVSWWISHWGWFGREKNPWISPMMLKKGDPEVAHPRVLIGATACCPLYSSVMKLLWVNFALMIKSCECHSLIWIRALDCSLRRLANEINVHRDTAWVSVGNLSVIVFLQTSESRGVKFWKQLQNLCWGNEWNQPMDLTEVLASSKAIVVRFPINSPEWAYGTVPEKHCSFRIACNCLDIALDASELSSVDSCVEIWYYSIIVITITQVNQLSYTRCSMCCSGPK